MAEEETRESAEKAFQAYGRPLKTVTSFKYLGRVLTAADDGYPEVVGNLQKARESWTRLTRILGRKGASPRVPGMFSRQSAGGDFIWVGDVGSDPPHGTAPGKLLAQGRQVDNGEATKTTRGGGVWEYPPLETTM